MLLAGKVAVVSGVGPGLGRSAAVALAGQGAGVVLAARSSEELERVAAEIRAAGGEALPVVTDITRKDDCEALVQRARERFGRLDILVNNAFKGGVEPLFENTDLDQWRQIFEVNVFGSLQLTQAAVRAMKPQGSGSIVFVNSMSMRIIEPGMGGYASSKGALMVAAQTLARELGPYGIRVNSVVPGYIWSEKLAGYFRYLARQQNRTYEEVHAEITGRTALRHIPEPDEIAGAIVFLASDLSRAITGQAIDVNGGHYFH